MTHIPSELMHDTEALFSHVLGPELAELVWHIRRDPGSVKDYVVPIPEANSVDFNVEEMQSIVARASNYFARMARHHGVATSLHVVAEMEYKRKFKSALIGNNKEAREANAIEAAGDEALCLSIITAAVKITEDMKEANRIASETARKLLGSMESMYTAANREEKGVFRQSDFDDNQWF